MPALLSEKGKEQPRVTVHIEANARIEVWLNWKKPYSSCEWDTESEYCFGDSFVEASQKAIKFIAGLPSAEQAKLHHFMGELGKVIDGGRDAGIAVDFMNPLEATMKRLSENVITHQRAES